MQYPIVIEWGDAHTATGVIVPDIPGAITAADTVEAAYDASVEVAHIQLEVLSEAGQDIPSPNPITKHRQNPDYEGWGWGFIDIDITPYLGKTEKINVTLPGTVIRQIDQYVSRHKAKSRSAFLAAAALEKLRNPVAQR
jgi:predicted RNase H-like HicB family nuclease